MGIVEPKDEPAEAEDAVLFNRAVQMAGGAMYAAMSDRWKTAMRLVQRIGDDLGGEALTIAMLAWADAYTEHATDGDPDCARPKHMTMINSETGAMQTIEDSAAPAHIKWAAKWVHARSSMDHDRCQQLLKEMPTDELETGQYIGAVLRCCADTINGLPRGFARMGQDRMPDVDTLLQLRRDLWTLADIAAKYGVSPNDVYLALRTAGRRTTHHYGDGCPEHPRDPAEDGQQ